ncbi:DNA-binding transcriptional regulator [Edaphobacter acidisoli]|uniref:DNA-binding transcriptional regulator n=2 Tax=Edaphobacter acidisoli TaxID=2040573 RepID=A0A916W8F9_9BACT|nr:DNA-binding transcriptional regulator [Edaphobacter acidisoli]
MTKIARLYYEQGLRQQAITDRLSIHQSTISRLLKRARSEGVVRISVAIPNGVFTEMEQALEERYGIQEAVVVDTLNHEENIARDLGTAAAFWIETRLKPGMVIGISSWSRSLIAMLDSLHQNDQGRDGTVVQILGGVGNTGSQYHANRLAHDLASRIKATPILLQAPAVVATAGARDVLSRDPAVKVVSNLFKKLDVALVGVGAVQPSSLLASSGNVFSVAELKKMQALGAVGDICLRFFDAQGAPIKSTLMDRVIGIDLPTLKKAKTVVGIAGGGRKLPAIHAALLGGWINVLITDRHTAEQLLSHKDKA